jgi:hypothetical protein
MIVVVLVKLATASAVCHGVASRRRTVGAQQQECREGLSLNGSALARETVGVESRGRSLIYRLAGRDQQIGQTRP